MKLSRIIQAIYFDPWSITPDGWQTLHAMLKPRLLSENPFAGLELPQPKADASETDIYGNPLPKMEITPDGVAIIPIMGTLIHHATLFEKICGACSYDDIKRDVRTALGTAGLNKIVFHVDSPGGMCMGCHETAGVIADAGQFVRTEAVTDSVMASAAYYLVASCDRISCTPTARPGSIGAMLAWLDESVRFEMAGLKVEVLASGPLKGTGTRGTSLTDEQRAYMQGTIDKYAGMFKAHVLEYRPIIDASSMQGQVFIGSDAADAGLVDEIVDDIEIAFDPHSAAYADSDD